MNSTHSKQRPSHNESVSAPSKMRMFIRAFIVLAWVEVVISKNKFLDPHGGDEYECHMGKGKFFSENKFLGSVIIAEVKVRVK